MRSRANFTLWAQSSYSNLDSVVFQVFVEQPLEAGAAGSPGGLQLLLDPAAFFKEL